MTLRRESLDDGPNAERQADSRAAPKRPLKVAVLIGLDWSPRSGGHVKSWERLAEALVRRGGDVALDVHVTGPAHSVTTLSPAVRFVTHRQVFSTRRLPFLRGMPDHADLASHHRGLFAELRGIDVIHTTDCHFAFAKTGLRAARENGAALVNSLHTNNVGYTRVFSEQLIRRLAPGTLAGLLVDRLRVPVRLENRMQREFTGYLAHCDHVMASMNDDLRALATVTGTRRTGAGRDPDARVSVLRRGIDTARFNPQRRDRARLLSRLGIAGDRAILLFAGRIDRSKNVATLAEAARALLQQGETIHVVFAGDGSQRAEIALTLGRNATFLGPVSQDDLAGLYASSDLFVFPSRLDVAPNVVVEAKASGLPVLVAPSGGDRFVRTSGVDGIVVDDESPAAWSSAIAALLADPARRIAVGTAGFEDVRRRFPSWDDVLAEDVLPVWHAVARR